MYSISNPYRQTRYKEKDKIDEATGKNFKPLQIDQILANCSGVYDSPLQNFKPLQIDQIQNKGGNKKNERTIFQTLIDRLDTSGTGYYQQLITIFQTLIDRLDTKAKDNARRLMVEFQTLIDRLDTIFLSFVLSLLPRFQTLIDRLDTCRSECNS